MRHMAIGAVAVAILLVGTVPAIGGTEAGMTEIGGAFSLTSRLVKDGDTSIGWTALGLGKRFVTDTTALGARVMVSGTSDDGESSTMTYLWGLADFHIPTDSTTVPYVGLGAGTFIFSGENTVDPIWMGDLHAGLKNFVSEDLAVVFEVGYNFGFGEGIDMFEVGILTGTVGLSTFF